MRPLFIACSFAKALLDNAAPEVKEQVNNQVNICGEYKLIYERVATEKNIKGTLCYSKRDSIRSWVISDDWNVCKKLGSKFGHSGIFSDMYEDPEIDNSPDAKNIREAAKTGDLKKVEELINKGVRVDSIDENGDNLLDIAIEHGRKDIIELLEQAALKQQKDEERAPSTSLNVTTSTQNPEHGLDV